MTNKHVLAQACTTLSYRSFYPNPKDSVAGTWTLMAVVVLTGFSGLLRAPCGDCRSVSRLRVFRLYGLGR